MRAYTAAMDDCEAPRRRFSVAATSSASTFMIGNLHDMPPLIPWDVQHGYREPMLTTLCGARLAELALFPDLLFPYRESHSASACPDCLAALSDPLLSASQAEPRPSPDKVGDAGTGPRR